MARAPISSEERKQIIKAREKAHRLKMRTRTDVQIMAERRRLHPTGKKRCCRCKKRKTFGEFWRESRFLDGLKPCCSTCCSKAQKGILRRRRKRTQLELIQCRKTMRPKGIKKCCGCKKEKRLSMFGNSKNAADGLQDRCKVCHGRISKKHREELNSIRNEFRSRGCIVCGEKDVRCIDLAHRNSQDKAKNKWGITIDPSQITNISLLINELKLVDPMCAIDHADMTYEEQKGKVATGMAAQRREMVNQEKTKRGSCIDCKSAVNGKFWRFDFDHVRGKKILCISDMVSYGYPIAVIQVEMCKCDLRCKNCHRKRTFSDKPSGLQQLLSIDTTKN